MGGTSLQAVPAWLWEGEEKARFGRAELFCSHSVAVHPSSSWSPASFLSNPAKAAAGRKSQHGNISSSLKMPAAKQHPGFWLTSPCHGLAPGDSKAWFVTQAKTMTPLVLLGLNPIQDCKFINEQLVRFSPPEQTGTTLILQALKPQVILTPSSRATSNTITTAPERPHRQERLFTSYYFALHECTNTRTNFSSFELQAAPQSTFVLRNNFSLCQLVRVLCSLSLALKPRVQSKCSGSWLTEQSYSFSIPWQA